MKLFRRIALLLLLVFGTPAFAFDTVDEQIAHYLDLLENGSYESQIQMLERLQWSGLTDHRLYNQIKARLEYSALSAGKSINKRELNLLAHMIRALGYSGNERYRNALENIKNYSKNNKLRKHASKALVQLNDFIHWNRLVADSDYNVTGKSVEVTTYMKMLGTDDAMVQRLAARAMFHERQGDMDLLALAAEKLEGLYLKPGLNREAQDTAAWLCKAIGENASWHYDELMAKVARNSPYKGVRKHAAKYVP